MSASPRPPGFTVFGFPLRVSPMFWGITLVFVFAGQTEYTTELFVKGLIWVPIVFVSILWHELGHAFAMRRFGYTPSIELYGMGGRTMWGAGPRNPSPQKRIVVSLAGPFAGFLLGGVTFGAAVALGTGQHWAIEYAIEMALWVNIGWGVLNLVPMLPWDGGHVMEGVFDVLTKGKGRRPAAIVTIAIALALALTALYFWGFSTAGIWSAFLCLMSLSVGVRVLRAKPPSLASPELEPTAALARARQILGRAGPPERLVSAILMGSQSPEWGKLADDLEKRVAPGLIAPAQRAVALELAGWAHLLSANPRGARDAVDAMRPSHDPSPILAALVATMTGAWEEALDAVESIHPEEAEGAKRIEAYALAARGRPESAMAAIANDHTAGALVDAALFHAGAYDAAAELAAHLFDRFGEAEDAYNAACSHARAGRAEEGLSWLERAVDAGYTDLAHLEADDDLENVRALEGFGTLRDKLQT